jgi:hypothetical protein
MPGFCIILPSAYGGLGCLTDTPRLKGRSLHFPPIIKKIPSIQNFYETTDWTRKLFYTTLILYFDNRQKT